MADVRAVDAREVCERLLTDRRVEPESRFTYAFAELDGESFAERGPRTCSCHLGDSSVAQ